MSPYQVFSMALGEYGTNAYLLVSGLNAIAIDAPPGACHYYTSITRQKGLTLHALLLTHGHFDHISDAKMIQDKGVKVGIHKEDARNCRSPGSDGLPLMMPVGPFEPDFIIDEGLIELAGVKIQVMHTPGHSPGGVCFIVDHLLFSGDTLFKGAIGNLSFPGCDPAKMQRSLQSLLDLKGDYLVYPGHGPKTGLDHERNYIQKTLHSIGKLCH